MASSTQATLAQDSQGPTLVSTIRATLVRCSEGLISYLHDSFITDLGFSFDCAMVFISVYTPFWYFRYFHPQAPNGIELGENHHSEPDNSHRALGLKEHWVKVARQVSEVWETHKLIVSVALALMFPLISTSPLPKCSWGYVFAIISLVYSLITLTICVAYGVYLHGIDEHNLPTSWNIAPNSSFFDRDVVRFYVFLSLPTIWFAGLVISFAMTVFFVAAGGLASYKQLEVDPTASVALCSNLNLLFAVIPGILIVVAITYARSIKYVQENFFDGQHPFDHG